MTKTDIITLIADQLDMTRKEAESVLERALEIIKEELSKSREVMISGFGKWSVLTKKPRKGRNPQTGEALVIKGRKVLTFKTSAKLRNDLQQEGWT